MPPAELREARIAYGHAKSQAAEAPMELDEARRALAAAEKRFEEIGAEPEVASLGFVADRKAKRAESVARRIGLERELTKLHEAALAREKETALRAQKEAEKAREEAERKQREIDQVNAQRRAAEEREQKALEALKRLSSGVRTEPRGLVITLAGAVLFASNGATLTPAAKTRLDELAQVLQRDNPTAKLVVEGHTDNQGSHQSNTLLSKARAEAVAGYLVKKGIAKDRVRTEAVGESRPLSSNTSSEGRATNRRVEIVVER
jgi:outer membrane protein OmpA-like peptidoglycan-associated protein